jgi:hypothetical protein
MGGGVYFVSPPHKFFARSFFTLTTHTRAAHFAATCGCPAPSSAGPLPLPPQLLQPAVVVCRRSLPVARAAKQRAAMRHSRSMHARNGRWPLVDGARSSSTRQQPATRGGTHAIHGYTRLHGTRCRILQVMFLAAAVG